MNLESVHPESTHPESTVAPGDASNSHVQRLLHRNKETGVVSTLSLGTEERASLDEAEQKAFWAKYEEVRLDDKAYCALQKANEFNEWVAQRRDGSMTNIRDLQAEARRSILQHLLPELPVALQEKLKLGREIHATSPDGRQALFIALDYPYGLKGPVSPDDYSIPQVSMRISATRATPDRNDTTIHHTVTDTWSGMARPQLLDAQATYQGDVALGMLQQEVANLAKVRGQRSEEWKLAGDVAEHTLRQGLAWYATAVRSQNLAVYAAYHYKDSKTALAMARMSSEEDYIRLNGAQIAQAASDVYAQSYQDVHETLKKVRTQRGKAVPRQAGESGTKGLSLQSFQPLHIAPVHTVNALEQHLGAWTEAAVGHHADARAFAQAKLAEKYPQALEPDGKLDLYHPDMAQDVERLILVDDVQDPQKTMQLFSAYMKKLPTFESRHLQEMLAHQAQR